jgi:hypothetical protein
MELIYSTELPFSNIIFMRICAPILTWHQLKKFFLKVFASAAIHERSLPHPDYCETGEFPSVDLANKSRIVGRRFSDIGSSAVAAFTSLFEVLGRTVRSSSWIIRQFSKSASLPDMLHFQQTTISINWL